MVTRRRVTERLIDEAREVVEGLLDGSVHVFRDVDSYDISGPDVADIEADINEYCCDVEDFYNEVREKQRFLKYFFEDLEDELAELREEYEKASRE